MKLGVVVNVMNSELAGASTYRLAAAAVTRGHETWVMSTGSFSYNEDDTIGAFARSVPPGRYSSESFLKTLAGPKAIERWIVLDELDVLLLRNNPPAQRAWAQGAGIHFGRLAVRRGVIVLNDPDGLSRAMNKLYLQGFPETVRPATLVTRYTSRVQDFLDDHGTAIVKPLQGSGGTGVFIIRKDEKHNLEEIVNAVGRDGYMVVQEYLTAASEGDTRIFLMNGLPLKSKGHYAAFRRVRSGDDLRSNIHAGGKLRKAEITDRMLELCEIVRPKIVQDGMFLVGLDVVGDKLMEINVFTPGGLGSAQMFEKIDFTSVVLDAIERKAAYMKCYKRRFDNSELATL